METKIRLRSYLRLLSISLCLFSSVHSVPLGPIDLYGNEVIPAKAGIQINMRNENSGSPPGGVDDVKSQQSLKPDNFDFYKDYLAKYYPKVFVMCRDYFIGMTAKDFEKSLGSVVDLLRSKPWFYFTNRPKGFKITQHWELIADQLSWLNEFIRTAWYDPAIGCISMPTEEDEDDFLRSFLATGSLQQSKKCKQLDDYLISLKSTVIYTFYAFSFDYIIKLFNDAIFTGSSEKASFYFDQLEYIMSQLKKHNQSDATDKDENNQLDPSYEYEIIYQEHLQTAKEVFELFKQKNVDRCTEYSAVVGKA